MHSTEVLLGMMSVPPAIKMAKGPVNDPPVWAIGALANKISSEDNVRASIPRPQTTL